MADRVTVRAADLVEVLADAAASEGYDAIWASDVVWPGNFADPAATVAGMAAALRPGGVLALFYSNYYRATFLPGHSRLERLILAASQLRWKLPAEGPHHHDRHLAWLLGAGLVDVDLSVFPRVGRADDAAVRAYLETTVWPEHLQSVRECGHLVGLDGSDLDEIQALLIPGSGRYVLDEPGHYVMHPAVLASGRRAAGQGLIERSATHHRLPGVLTVRGVPASAQHAHVEPTGGQTRHRAVRCGSRLRHGGRVRGRHRAGHRRPARRPAPGPAAGR